MLKVGLTGGIATGKSFILSVFRELGCEVIDADLVAHQVMEPGRPAFDEIVAHFGEDVIGPDGKLDRGRIGALVFADKAQREKLNSIVHPRVFEAQAVWFAEVEGRNPDAIAVVDAALMIETGSWRRFDKLIVAWCAPELQLQRLIERNSLTEEQARARIAAQMPSDEKLKFADYAIDTSRGFEDTRSQVEAVYGQLLAQYSGVKKL
ncbi:MAG: dephospho-CoA kinase [Acidobacteriota bacterium]|nr:MAG: dephospho-CoA kinase [Acidobacteriota bacterium]